MTHLKQQKKARSFTEYVAQQAESYELFKEDIGGFTPEQIDMALDGITTALDAWGLEQLTGWIGDLLSAGLSAGRGAVKLYQGDKSRAAGHGIDAAASLISAIPLGDVAKLIKLRKGSNYARLFIKAAKPARAAAKTHKAGRQAQRAGGMGQGIARKIGGEIGPIIQGQPGSVAAMAKG